MASHFPSSEVAALGNCHHMSVPYLTAHAVGILYLYSLHIPIRYMSESEDIRTKFYLQICSTTPFERAIYFNISDI